MEATKFAKVISCSRQNKKMTQEEFASRLGVTPQAVSKWERGMGLPDMSLMDGICTILSVSADELLGINFNPVVENNNLSDQKDILNQVCSEPVILYFGENIIPSVAAGLKTDLINDKRKQLVSETGMLVPVIRIKDEISLEPNEFCIQLYDKILVKGEVKEINDNTYSELVTRLFETCRDNYVYLLNKQIVRILIDTVKQSHPGIADGIIPEKIPYLTYQKVLASIINKGANIKNHIKIIEYVEDEMLLKGNTDIESISSIYVAANDSTQIGS